MTALKYPPLWMTKLVAAANLLAILDLPYGYYQLLRLVVTGYGAYVSYLYFKQGLSAWAWSFAFIALLYNPVFLITMSKEFHGVVNVLVAVAILVEWKIARAIAGQAEFPDWMTKNRGDFQVPFSSSEKSIGYSDDTMAAGPTVVEAASGGWSRSYIVAGLAVAAIVVVAVLGWLMPPQIEPPVHPPRVAQEQVLLKPSPEAPTAGPELAAGETFEWSAETASSETVRQVGPLVVRITRKTDGDLAAPVITVSRGADSVTMVGEMVSSGYTHRISAVRNIAGAPSVVMLQSFSGGAHCCNNVQLSGLSGGQMKVIDLGAWDGDEIPVPTDLNGDGLADFVERDNAFLYAFAAYAMSYAPPTILNVTGGRIVDVSRRGAYRRLYLDEMAKAGETCRTASDGMSRNGACPSYVASAARVGLLDEAWTDMLRSYSATEDWAYPTGCALKTGNECPEVSRVVYKSYPEALLAFLKEHGYVDAGWMPRATIGDEVNMGGETGAVETY
ncbi:DUF6804 family protein [Sphingobium aromaticiconvertens]|uniref:DUF6804 family protein n=1 Tax=Sphingobium aromaticiconvertens TaxID=365341 RepID=UPI00301A5925